MKRLAFLLFAAAWMPAWAEEATEKEPASTPAETSTPDPPYKMTSNEKRLVRFLLELKQSDVGKTHKNDLLNYGSSDKPSSSPVLMGFRNGEGKKQHIYLFRFGQHHIAYAWVEKGGTPIPIPDVPEGTIEENASHYGIEESVTDTDVLDGEGIYMLRGATLKWLEELEASAEEDAAGTENLLAEAKPSHKETIRLLDLGPTRSDEYRIVVDVNGLRTPLPAAPEEMETTGQAAWSSPARPEFLLSPDGRWIFATQKVCTGYSIGCLYQRQSNGSYAITTPIRFDALAWKFFAEQEEVSVEDLLSSDAPAHLMDALALTNHFLALRLRGAVFEISHHKAVPQRPENSIDETGVYDWCCVYDLEKGKFLVTADMETHNRSAWKRWASGDNDTWKADSLLWLESVEARLIKQMQNGELAAYRKEQAAWMKELEISQKDKNFSALDFIRLRGGEIETRILELKRR